MKNLFTLSFFVICLNTFSQQPVFIVLGNVSGYDLYSVDINNCTRQFKGSTGQAFMDIAFTPDGRLWGISGLELYRIDTSNAAITFVANTPMGLSKSLVALNDSILLMDGGGKLYGLNNITGATYPIDSIGVTSHGDLTWYDNDLYMVTPLNKIELNSSNTAVISVTPLPTIPSLLGAVTVSYPDESCNAIIGFHLSNTYKINPFNGSSQVICPGLNPTSVWGAASIRLPVQFPIPEDCDKILPVEMISGQINKFELAPNPVYSSFSYSFDSPTDGDFLIRIIDLWGRESKSEKMNVTMGINKKTCNVSDLNEGMYVFQISNMKSGHMIQSMFLKTE